MTLLNQRVKGSNPGTTDNSLWLWIRCLDKVLWIRCLDKVSPFLTIFTGDLLIKPVWTDGLLCFGHPAEHGMGVKRYSP